MTSDFMTSDLVAERSSYAVAQPIRLRHRLLRLLGLLLVAHWSLVLLGCSQASPDPAPDAGGADAGGEVRPAASDAEPGGRLLFVSGGNLWIWEGGATRQLTEDGRWWQAAWSPDGSRIACVMRGESASDLFLLDPDGREPARLTANGSDHPPGSYERIYDTIWAFYPAWSPDGGQLLYASQAGTAVGSPAADYNLTLYLMPVGGGASRQLLADETAQLGRARFDPSGRRIAFDRFPSGGEAASQVQLYSLDEGSSAPFPGVPEQSYDPAWSPDGRFLAFAARDGDATDVFLLDLNAGTGPLRLTGHGRARAPTFSPDGSQIAYLAEDGTGFQLYAAPLLLGEGAPRLGEAEQLTAGPGIDADSGVSWGP
jgi:TolB protein